MTPKEKASELVKKFSAVGLQRRAEGIVCALIAVDQIILEQCKGSELKDPCYQDERLIYWQQVKNEIEKL